VGEYEQFNETDFCFVKEAFINELGNILERISNNNFEKKHTLFYHNLIPDGPFIKCYFHDNFVFQQFGVFELKQFARNILNFVINVSSNDEETRNFIETMRKELLDVKDTEKENDKFFEYDGGLASELVSFIGYLFLFMSRLEYTYCFFIYKGDVDVSKYSTLEEYSIFQYLFKEFYSIKMIKRLSIFFIKNVSSKKVIEKEYFQNLICNIFYEKVTWHFHFEMIIQKMFDNKNIQTWHLLDSLHVFFCYVSASYCCTSSSLVPQFKSFLEKFSLIQDIHCNCISKEMQHEFLKDINETLKNKTAGMLMNSEFLRQNIQSFLDLQKICITKNLENESIDFRYLFAQFIEKKAANHPNKQKIINLILYHNYHFNFEMSEKEQIFTFQRICDILFKTEKPKTDSEIFVFQNIIENIVIQKFQFAIIESFFMLRGIESNKYLFTYLKFDDVGNNFNLKKESLTQMRNFYDMEIKPNKDFLQPELKQEINIIEKILYLERNILDVFFLNNKINVALKEQQQKQQDIDYNFRQIEKIKESSRHISQKRMTVLMKDYQNFLNNNNQEFLCSKSQTPSGWIKEISEFIENDNECLYQLGENINSQRELINENTNAESFSSYEKRFLEKLDEYLTIIKIKEENLFEFNKKIGVVVFNIITLLSLIELQIYESDFELTHFQYQKISSVKKYNYAFNTEEHMQIHTKLKSYKKAISSNYLSSLQESNSNFDSFISSFCSKMKFNVDNFKSEHFMEDILEQIFWDFYETNSSSVLFFTYPFLLKSNLLTIFLPFLQLNFEKIKDKKDILDFVKSFPESFSLQENFCILLSGIPLSKDELRERRCLKDSYELIWGPSDTGSTASTTAAPETAAVSVSVKASSDRVKNSALALEGAYNALGTVQSQLINAYNKNKAVADDEDEMMELHLHYARDSKGLSDMPRYWETYLSTRREFSDFDHLPRNDKEFLKSRLFTRYRASLHTERENLVRDLLQTKEKFEDYFPGMHVTRALHEQQKHLKQQLLSLKQNGFEEAFEVETLQGVRLSLSEELSKSQITVLQSLAKEEFHSCSTTDLVSVIGHNEELRNIMFHTFPTNAPLPLRRGA
jgi:hypothetical protein